MIPALLALGALVGPVQPINAELAVEVAYPADENAIEALQQLCGHRATAADAHRRPSRASRAHGARHPTSLRSLCACARACRRCGNLFSALLVPVAERAADVDLAIPLADGTTVRGDSVLLGVIALSALGVFSGFDAELKRSAVDSADAPAPALVVEPVD